MPPSGFDHESQARTPNFNPNQALNEIPSASKISCHKSWHHDRIVGDVLNTCSQLLAQAPLHLSKTGDHCSIHGKLLGTTCTMAVARVLRGIVL